MHPGEILDEEFLGPLGITAYHLAEAIRVIPPRVYKILRGERTVSADTALRLGRYFGTGPRGVILKCLRYMGDHPSFPQEEVPFHQALPRGDLFLDLGQRGWTPLFPFIITMTCSHCKARETYFIDAWDTRRGTVRMKSFERATL